MGAMPPRGGGFSRQPSRGARCNIQGPPICRRGGGKIEKVVQNDAFWCMQHQKNGVAFNYITLQGGLGGNPVV